MFCAIGYHYQHVLRPSIWDCRFLEGQHCTHLENSVTARRAPRRYITDFPQEMMMATRNSLKEFIKCLRW